MSIAAFADVRIERVHFPYRRDFRFGSLSAGYQGQHCRRVERGNVAGVSFGHIFSKVVNPTISRRRDANAPIVDTE